MDPISQPDVTPWISFKQFIQFGRPGRKAMKSKILLMILIFATAFVLYVAAQSNATKEFFDTKGYPLHDVSEQGAKTPVTRCTGPVMATDGTAKCLCSFPFARLLGIHHGR